MEEDLKRLIKKCDECKLNECINCEISYSDIQTIKYLIKAYKDLKEIEESHRKENGELRERVKELEEENKIIKGNYYTLSADIQMITSELGFPEDTIIADEMVSMIKENYIPISLVKEKIEELDNKTKEIFCKYMTEEEYYANKTLWSDISDECEMIEVKELIYARKVLQELLEKR